MNARAPPSPASAVGYDNLAADFRHVTTYHSVCPMPILARARAVSPRNSPAQPYISFREHPTGMNSDIADGVGVRMILILVCKLRLQSEFAIIISCLKQLLMPCRRWPKPTRPRPRRST